MQKLCCVRTRQQFSASLVIHKFVPTLLTHISINSHPFLVGIASNSINQWSPILGGGWYGQACVTIVSDNGAQPCENDAAAQTIVVLGGGTPSEWCTNSVIVWDPSTMEWRLGPNLNDKRAGLVAVVCGDKVYAIGGDGGRGALDTMESI